MALASATALLHDDLGTRPQQPAPPRTAKPTWRFIGSPFGVDTPALQPAEPDVARTEIRTLPRLLPVVDESQPRTEHALIPLQSWEGVVLEVSESSFLVRLADAAGEHVDEELELAKDELSPFDLDLLEPGAIFYWTIGYRQQLPAGARERVSRIRFRRLPAWSDGELAQARKRAAALADDLGW